MWKVVLNPIKIQCLLVKTEFLFFIFVFDIVVVLLQNIKKKNEPSQKCGSVGKSF